MATAKKKPAKTSKKSKTLKKSKPQKSKQKAGKTIAKKVAIKRKPKKVAAIPKGYNTVTPYLVVTQGNKAIDFYKKAFGAKELSRLERPDGKIGHAELKVGDSKIMLADECPKQAKANSANNSASMFIHLYVKDVDAIVKNAVAAGAKLVPTSALFSLSEQNFLLKSIG